MAFNEASARKHLKEFSFTDLFVEDLGWDRKSISFPVEVAGQPYALHSPVHKAGLHVFFCPPAPGGTIPDYPTRRRIERLVAKSFVEHLVIFTDAARTTQVWQWMKREKDKPVQSREHTCHVPQVGPLIQKLRRLQFTLDEEEQGISIVHSTGRARDAFDVEKVTKKFYEQFRKEHGPFLQCIVGFPPPVPKKDGKKGETEPHPDLQWYTSLTLNRLMFVYFIQKKCFLDGDPDYLQNRLKLVRTKRGADKFHSFYRLFLLHLFHEGLGKQKGERDAELAKLIGAVPYLNGGFFEVHQLERDYPGIDIPDKAFARLFAFFDTWDWVLDTRLPRDLSSVKERKDEINPDVVGYIFEKYVNQKQMGAYYTKEDITGYITRSTVIPFILDRAARECAVAFQPEGPVWKLLAEDPERYIHEPVRRGVLDAKNNVIPLPPDIEAGIDDIPRRAGWNKPAPAPYALPTETWREHVARRQRCLDLRAKLAAGQITTVNDLITHNLDLRQFAQDIITNTDGPDLLKAIWQAVRDITILDPTCGSGAFLFAALTLLEPLYAGCLDKMQALLDDAARLGDKKRLARLAEFQAILDGIARHANEDYFVVKSIIVNNLYGVDIMEEAVEICRLRLFLKLVSQLGPDDEIEPLPDIDFNIRPGNTLVGYSTLDQAKNAIEFGSLDFAGTAIRIDQSAANASRLFRKFRDAQLDGERTNSSALTRTSKQAFINALRGLAQELDQYLATECGFTGNSKLAEFREKQHPFHWFVEFYEIMHAGGFDVIVGNPPYVATAKVKTDYTGRGYKTERCSDIYAWCLERASQLINDLGYTGMIVPLSLGFSGDFGSLRSLLYASYKCNWFSSFGRIPAALFAHDVRVRNTIHLGAKQSASPGNYATRLHRWFDIEREHLFSAMSYAHFQPEKWKERVPKLNSDRLIHAFEQRLRANGEFESAISEQRTKYFAFFKKTAYNWLNFCRTQPPCYDEQGKSIAHSQFDELSFPDKETLDIAILLLNGKLQLVFWIAVGDDFHVTRWMFENLPLTLAQLDAASRKELLHLSTELDIAMSKAVSFKLNAGKRVGNFNLARCRAVTNKSDAILAKAYGFDDVWDDIELLYAQVVRTDFDDLEEA